MALSKTQEKLVRRASQVANPGGSGVAAINDLFGPQIDSAIDAVGDIFFDAMFPAQGDMSRRKSISAPVRGGGATGNPIHAIGQALGVMAPAESQTTAVPEIFSTLFDRNNEGIFEGRSLNLPEFAMAATDLPTGGLKTAAAKLGSKAALELAGLSPFAGFLRGTAPRPSEISEVMRDLQVSASRAEELLTPTEHTLPRASGALGAMTRAGEDAPQMSVKTHPDGRVSFENLAHGTVGSIVPRNQEPTAFSRTHDQGLWTGTPKASAEIIGNKVTAPGRGGDPTRARIFLADTEPLRVLDSPYELNRLAKEYMETPEFKNLPSGNHEVFIMDDIVKRTDGAIEPTPSRTDPKLRKLQFETNTYGLAGDVNSYESVNPSIHGSESIPPWKVFDDDFTNNRLADNRLFMKWLAEEKGIQGILHLNDVEDKGSLSVLLTHPKYFNPKPGGHQMFGVAGGPDVGPATIAKTLEMLTGERAAGNMTKREGKLVDEIAARFQPPHRDAPEIFQTSEKERMLSLTEDQINLILDVTQRQNVPGGAYRGRRQGGHTITDPDMLPMDPDFNPEELLTFEEALMSTLAGDMAWPGQTGTHTLNNPRLFERKAARLQVEKLEHIDYKKVQSAYSHGEFGELVPDVTLMKKWDGQARDLKEAKKIIENSSMDQLLNPDYLESIMMDFDVRGVTGTTADHWGEIISDINNALDNLYLKD